MEQQGWGRNMHSFKRKGGNRICKVSSAKMEMEHAQLLGKKQGKKTFNGTREWHKAAWIS
eukprot:1156723-Pelagomonas_calceolata.AAC.17